MSGITKPFIGLLLLTFGASQTLFPQEDNCSIYEQVLVYLNEKEGQTAFLYAPPPNGFNPTDTFTGYKEEVEGKLALEFHIVTEITSFESRDLKRFSNFLQDSTLLGKRYQTTKGKVTGCEFQKVDKYRFSEFREVISFTEEDSYSTGEGEKALHYNPARIVFSNILYHNESLALVTAKVKVGLAGGPGHIYGFIFSKEDSWELQKVVSKPL